MVNILIACEFSGIVRDAFKEKGHYAVSCDLLSTERVGNHIIGDVRKEINFKKFDLMIAHPPCTHLAVSGARWFEKKIKEQKEAIEFFMYLINVPIKYICIENPISIMSTVYKKPDQIIQPWQYGHGETKKTCFWLKNLPKLKETNIVNGRDDRVHKMGPSKMRWKNRSRTYKGIADAMADQWGKYINENTKT